MSLNKITRTNFANFQVGDKITAFGVGVYAPISISGIVKIDATRGTIPQGTVMSYITATKDWVVYNTANSGASDGSQSAAGVIGQEVTVSVETAIAPIIIDAYLQKEKLNYYVAGTATAGYDAGALTDLRGKEHAYTVSDSTNTIVKIG